MQVTICDRCGVKGANKLIIVPFNSKNKKNKNSYCFADVDIARDLCEQCFKEYKILVKSFLREK